MAAKTILAAIRVVVSNVSGVVRVNSNRKTDFPASGKFSASVLYRGEDIERWIINNSALRHEHNMPLAIDVRTTSASDDDLIDKVYAILDAVLLPANKPTGVISIEPVSIDEPDGDEFLTCRINLIAKFRRS